MSASDLSRRRFLGTLGSLALASTLSSHWGEAMPRLAPGKTASGRGRKPNIVFILADDLGLDGVSYTGGDLYYTPHIDTLARTGLRFDYCYSTPLCGPSRAQLLTGRYPFRTGMLDNSTETAMKPAREIMIPRVLKAAGYASASVGKWSQMPFRPSDWGFDEYFEFQNSGAYWSYEKNGGSYLVNGRKHQTPAHTYIPDLMHEFAVDFITRHRDEPFFLYYPLASVHNPILPTPDSEPGMRDFDTLYADNISYMDKLVGKLVAALGELGLRENTLIVFTGDNGTAQDEAARGTVKGQLISGAKHTLLEGGSRVPLVMNWRGTTPVGSACSDLTDFSDFLPTFAQLAGAPLPQDVIIDGHSFAPQIRGQLGTPRKWVYVELKGGRYVVTKKWKLNNNGVLFDMKNAPFAETVVPAYSTDLQASMARAHLRAIMVDLVGRRRALTPSNPIGMKQKRRRRVEIPDD